MRVVQINSVLGYGSTGRIAEEIGQVLVSAGHESYIAYGRSGSSSSSEIIKVGGYLDRILHGVRSMVFDEHGRGSRAATQRLVRTLESIRPDVVGLHNLHGYYINFEVLGEYLIKSGVPVVWTLHDCWPFTGHCAHFEFVGCRKWQTQCCECPLTQRYPKSLLRDNSANNFLLKRKVFSSLTALTIVTPSEWLKGIVNLSFLSGRRVRVINNGIDLGKFCVLGSSNSVKRKNKIVLGVANTWDRIKGLSDFVKLRALLPQSVTIVLIGLSRSQISLLPNGIVGIPRTETVEELVKWYNDADVFVNPTYVDNFPTTNLESLACGTPVVTYDSGGSPESVDVKTGIVVPKGDVRGLERAVSQVLELGRNYYQDHCRQRAEENYDKYARFLDYQRLYERIHSGA